jgi:hypothetical protein
MKMNETALDRLRDRGDWATIHLVRNRRGTWEIMLRVDGAYTYKEDGERMAQFWAEELRLRLDRDRMID